uniref:hypothetical protein n=1 Tax=Polynucleobacter sp. TaxID=2029855 RepID=UPI004047F178
MILICFSIILILILIPFVRISSKQIRDNNLEDSLALFTAFLLCILVFFPYWIFGEYSAIGWHDEYDLTIPWNIKLNQLKFGETFAHAFAGGTGVKQSTAWVEKISIIRILFEILPNWLSAAIYRILEMFLLFSGLYLSLKKILEVSSCAAFLGASVGSFISATPYGWALGGLNWLYSAIAWVPYIFFQSYRNQSARIILPAIYGAIVSMSVFPGFYLTGFFLFYIPFMFFIKFYKDYKLNYTHQIISVLLLIIPISLNWMNLPKFIKNIESDSARLNGVGTLQDAMNFLNNVPSGYTKNILYRDLLDLFNWGANYSNFMLIMCLIVSIVILFRRSDFYIIGAFSFFIIILPILSSVGYLLNINFLQNYRWNQNIDNALIWIALTCGLAFDKWIGSD